MTDKFLLLVDENDKKLGYAPQEECHKGEGKRHRAFVTLLFDSQNRVTLQKRKHRLFDNLWDLTAISHPLHIDKSTKSTRGTKGMRGEGRDETYQEASDRALSKEMGVGHVAVKKVGAFNYFARDGANCENEYCAILTGKYDGQYKPNLDEVYEVRKMAFDGLLSDIKNHPQKYTPWARLAVGLLEKLDLNKILHE